MVAEVPILNTIVSLSAFICSPKDKNGIFLSAIMAIIRVEREPLMCIRRGALFGANTRANVNKREKFKIVCFRFFRFSLLTQCARVK